jgi:hypothetical protein
MTGGDMNFKDALRSQYNAAKAATPKNPSVMLAPDRSIAVRYDIDDDCVVLYRGDDEKAYVRGDSIVRLRDFLNALFAQQE